MPQPSFLRPSLRLLLALVAFAGVLFVAIKAFDMLDGRGPRGGEETPAAAGMK